MALFYNLNGIEKRFECPEEAEPFLRPILDGTEYPAEKIPRELAPSVIVDVGAHMGAVTANFHARFPDATIHCYEPSPVHFDYLKKNTAGMPNVVLNNYGLFNQTCDIPLWVGKHSPHTLFRRPGTLDSEHESIKVVKASDEFRAKKLTNISILKIDVECCECMVLEDLFLNMDDLIVASMFIEYHSSEFRDRIVALLGGEFEVSILHEAVGQIGVMLLLNKAFLGHLNRLKHGAKK